MNLYAGDINSTEDEMLTAEVNKFGEYILANMVNYNIVNLKII